MPNRPLIALTAGDVAGIGPEILLRALRDPAIQGACHALVLCDPVIMQRAAELCGAGEQNPIVVVAESPQSHDALRQALIAANADGKILCFNPAGNTAGDAPTRQVSVAAGDAAFRYLTSAIRLATCGVVDAIATAPLNKAALHAAGHDFPGHTEILAQHCGVNEFAMMLHLPESRIAPLRTLVRTAADTGEPGQHGLSIAHVTLHTSVASVPHLLTTQGIVDTAELMHKFLKRIGCDRNAVAVCALNPHAGESGLFGDEEAHIIEPAVQQLQNRKTNLNITGPLPVDTLIRRAVAGEFDGVVAMYHDQGHIPIKLMGFDAAVNITLGLPIVRTSPTHGTAFDRAWNPKTPADPAGMIEAILMAAKLCEQSRTP
jgi:4-phospho-D-threonate 3-dehydrogenase / 4-phospho-D-erythronate 3-dehydrogenase